LFWDVLHSANVHLANVTYPETISLHSANVTYPETISLYKISVSVWPLNCCGLAYVAVVAL